MLCRADLLDLNVAINMHFTRIICIFTTLSLSILQGGVLCLPTAESMPLLTCTSAFDPDGDAMFHLNHAPISPVCDTSWEDESRLVIARGNKFNGSLVRNLTDQSITLWRCNDYLLYTVDCAHGIKEVKCTVNCTAELEPRRPASNESEPEINSFWQKYWRVLVGVMLGLVVVVPVIIYCTCTRVNRHDYGEVSPCIKSMS
ncbi:uncharacterized protein LOC117518246 [Thalassophryne amazonica]|uniref:uncharacterized protein LOC117518246 n=1 Tax=Thalassophryne amazonica TaxID=390379 RepID=UPI0014713369|nr:uncharacterized protein LOC117518246 [Thalassophryne amazonica]